MLPLAGVKVLDMGRALAAPFCGVLLGDLGADVIKIEPPGLGDDSREWPPLQGGESCYFLSVNRNKRGIVLNLGTEAGREAFRHLARSADVVIENYRAGIMAGWGLDYPRLRELNPRLIYCAITGFGSSGPYRSRPATDVAMQAFSGVSSLTGEPGRPPVRIGVSLTDLTSGVFSALAVVSAVHARSQSGQGQFLDVSLLGGQMAYLSYHLTSFFSTGKVPGPAGVGHPNIVPYQVFQASDGWLSLATFNDRMWKRCVIGMGLPELAEDPRFDTNPKRVERRAEVVGILSARFATKTVAEWMQVMAEADLPATPVNTIDRLVADPHVQAGGFIQEIEHPTAGLFKTFGFPMGFSETPCELRRPPPTLGQHTDEVLREFGLSDADIGRLRAEKGLG